MLLWPFWGQILSVLIDLVWGRRGCTGIGTYEWAYAYIFFARIGALYLVACGTFRPVHPYGLRRGFLRVVYDVLTRMGPVSL